MSIENDDRKLDSLLKRPYDKASESLLPDELAYLITSFLPSQEPSLRSKAYLVLSAFCQGVRNSPLDSKGSTSQQSDLATESLARVFEPSVVSHFSEPTESDQLTGLSFLAALFQVDWQSASHIFTKDGLIDFVMDSLDVAPSSSRLPLEVAHLLAQASGHKSSRVVVSSNSLDWLKVNSRQSTYATLRAACAIALIKLLKGSSSDSADAEATGLPRAPPDIAKEEDLAVMMKSLVLGENEESSLVDAVEGLAYLSVDASVKEVLVKDNKFLSRLLSLVPRRKKPSDSSIPNPTLIYGVVLIISNLCIYPRILSEEEAQMAKLKRMANSGKRPGDIVEDPRLTVLEDKEHIKERGRKLVAAGVTDALTAVVSATESRGTRAAVGRAFLSLVENQENRGKVLQSGGAKSLSIIIKQALSSDPATAGKLDAESLLAVQALAKLAITASPVQVFGPNDGAVYDAIRPFALMLLHPSATLLQLFESLMALTNISSRSPECAERISKFEGLMNKVEFLLLEDHTMVRRASMELVCNLVVGSDGAFLRWGRQSKLQILLALSDVDDLPTRLAASGALATVTTTPESCAALLSLQQERGRVLPILAQLIDPWSAGGESDPGLIHRGVICARNFLLGIPDAETSKALREDAQKAGLTSALINLVKSGKMDAAVLKATAEVLKYLKPETA